MIFLPLADFLRASLVIKPHFIYISAFPVIVIQYMVDVWRLLLLIVFHSLWKVFFKMSIILDISYAPLSQLLIQSFKCSYLLSDQIEVTRKLKVVSHFSLYSHKAYLTLWQLSEHFTLQWKALKTIHRSTWRVLLNYIVF